MSACGSNNTIAPAPPSNPGLQYYTLSSTGPTTINLPAYEGYTVTVTVPATTSGTGRVAFIEASVPPTGFPALASSLSRAPQVKGAPRKAASYPGISNGALFYIYMESDAPVTLSGYPGFKIQMPGSAGTPPYYMAYIAPLPPPPTNWNLNIEGPGGTSSPLNFTATSGPAVPMQPGNFYAYAPYVAAGPALAALPNAVVFMEPNETTSELLLDAAAVNLTGISSANTAVVTTSVSSGRTDVAGHFTFSLTSGSTPSSSTNVTVHDENGKSATIAVQNVVTNGTVTIPGLPQASQFTSGVSASPTAISPAPDGNVWFLESNNDVAQMQPDGTVTEYGPAPNSVSGGSIAAGPDAAVWFTEPGANRIGRVSTAAGTTGSMTDSNVLATAGGVTGPIVAGPDNNIWYAEASGVGIVGLNGQMLTEFNFGAGHNAAGLAAGPDGNVWVSDSLANAVTVWSHSGIVHSYPVPTSGAGLAGIAAGADGRMWVAESATGKLAAISMSGAITEYDVAAAAAPVSVAAGPDGNIWFGSGTGGNLGRVTPSGALTQFVTGTAAIDGIATGADGKLYFTEPTSNAIGRLSL